MPRSGSTWVSDVLHHLNNSTAYEEMFLRPSDGKKRVKMESQTSSYLQESIGSYPNYFRWRKNYGLRPFSVFRYLDRFYAQEGSVGFKLMYGQLQNFPEIWLYVIANKISVVHLVRENLLNAIISQVHSKTATVPHSIIEDRDKIPTINIKLDPHTTLVALRRKQRWIRWVRKLLELSHVRYIEVLYEDLLQNPESFLPLFIFLGEEDIDEIPTSRFVKLINSDHRELISNYPALEQGLAGTEFANLLDR